MAELSKRKPEVMVTYVPGPGDLPMTKWLGHTFNANVPKAVSHQGLIDAAKKNPFFRVDDGIGGALTDEPSGAWARVEKMFASPSFIDVSTLQQLMAQVKPEIEPDQLSGRYRKHAVEWLKGMESTDALIDRWAKDEPLRELCGVGTDDHAYLGTLFRPKLAELRRAEEIDNQKFMAICVAHGVAQLPW